jgi:hypothetical protein
MRGPSIEGKQLVAAVVPGRAEALHEGAVEKAADSVKILWSNSGDDPPEEILAALTEMGMQPEAVDRFRVGVEVAKSRHTQAERLIEEHTADDIIPWHSGHPYANGPVVLFKARARTSLAEVIAEEALAHARAEVEAELAALRAAYADVQQTKPPATADTTGDPLTDRLLHIIERQADPTININMREEWTNDDDG